MRRLVSTHRLLALLPLLAALARITGSPPSAVNVLLPDLCISIEGLVVDLIDRSSGQDGSAGGAGGPSSSSAASASSKGRDVLAARWAEPSRAHKEAGLLGTLVLTLETPVLFHLVAEAARLTLHAKGPLAVLNQLIGERTLVRIEAYVDVTKLTVSLACREKGIYLSISDLEMALARDGDVRCRSAEGGFVEWLVRAIPARVLDWVKKALQHNLRKEQLVCPWQSDAQVIGALDGLFRKLEWLEKLKQAAQRTVLSRGASGEWPSGVGGARPAGPSRSTSGESKDWHAAATTSSDSAQPSPRRL